MSGKRSRAFRAYQKVKTLRPARSLFDLSHDVLMTADMFKLYPVCAMEMSPGDTFHIWNESVTRMQPLNAPILSEIKQNTHYFFVPYRILWDAWVDFITGGSEGDYGGTNIGLSDTDKDNLADIGNTTPSIPLWNPANTGVGSLWDYFGLPVGVQFHDDDGKMCPVDFLRRAYNLIWNEFYRDENLQPEVSLQNEEILYRNWKKDYFTSALLSQQRGVTPVMPVSGSFGSASTSVINVAFPPNPSDVAIDGHTCFIYRSNIVNGLSNQDDPTNLNIPQSIGIDYYGSQNHTSYVKGYMYLRDVIIVDGRFEATYMVAEPPQVSYGIAYDRLPSITTQYYKNSIDFNDTSVGFDVKDLRQAFQIQKWLELANRGGVRYTEFLRSFFGVSPRDDRLQRPEYIGGSSSNVVVSEVLQTNASVAGSTPLAYMAGHGLGAERTYIGSYSACEYGILIGLMSYTTPPVYAQGINRQWLRRTKFDFLFPQFTGLSEQAILGAEIFTTGDSSEDRKVWGFNEIYDELRAMTSKVVGKMRSVFSYWHLARIFLGKPALNNDFISGKDVSKRIFAVPSEEGFIVHYANIIRALRPLPKYGTPKGV